MPLILPSDTSSRKYSGSVETIETEAQHSVSCTGDQANDEALNSKKNCYSQPAGHHSAGNFDAFLFGDVTGPISIDQKKGVKMVSTVRNQLTGLFFHGCPAAVKHAV